MTKENRNFGDVKYTDDFYFSRLRDELSASPHKRKVLIRRVDGGLEITLKVERYDPKKKKLGWVENAIFIGDDVGDRDHEYTYDDIQIPATTVRQLIEKGWGELAYEYAVLKSGLEGKYATAAELARMEQSCHVVRIGYMLYPEDRILRMREMIAEHPELFASSANEVRE